METEVTHTETTQTPPTEGRTLEAILAEYKPLAAQLGQITYEYEQKRYELLDRMGKLNTEALAVEKPESVN